MTQAGPIIVPELEKALRERAAAHDATPNPERPRGPDLRGRIPVLLTGSRQALTPTFDRPRCAQRLRRACPELPPAKSHLKPCLTSGLGPVICSADNDQCAMPRVGELHPEGWGGSDVRIEEP